jgi:hypothetical protein
MSSCGVGGVSFIATPGRRGHEMTDQEFRVAVRTALGAPEPMIAGRDRCPVCGQHIVGARFRLATHVTQCGTAGDLEMGMGCYSFIHRRLAGALAVVARDAGFGVRMEPQGMIPGTARRPGDLFLVALDDPAGATRLVDVSVRRATTATALETHRSGVIPGAVADAIERDKMRKYSDQVRASGRVFVPFGVEANGRLGSHAMALLDEMAWTREKTRGSRTTEARRLFLRDAVQTIAQSIHRTRAILAISRLEIVRPHT